MRFKLLGTEIYISFLFAAVITLMLLFDKTGMILPLLFAVFMHEMGHLFMMYIREASPKRIKLIPASVQITKAFSFDYKNDILISLSGPFVNILLFAVFYFNYKCYQNTTTLYIALLNLIMGVFNLLPVKGLDGGTILYCVLCRFTNVNRAELILNLISFLGGLTVLLAAIVLTLRNKINISLYIIGIYLLVTTLIKK